MISHTARQAAFSMAAAFALAGLFVSQPQNPGPKTISFSAIGKGGKPVTDLKLEEVQVSEDGKAQTATGIANTGNEPLLLSVLLDSSGSSLTTPTYWQVEVKSFINDLLRPGVDQGTILQFDSKTQVLQPPTDNVSLLTTAIDQVRRGGATALYDALAQAATAVERMQGRRALLLISDGYDTASRLSKEAALKTVHQSDVLVYAVTVEPTEFRRNPSALGKDFLEDLAAETGGRHLLVRNAKGMRTGLAEIAAELRAQYAITYQPTPNSRANGIFREVRLKVTRKDVKVRHPSGYYPR
jgi:Ca-activated chloride channel family protein